MKNNKIIIPAKTITLCSDVHKEVDKFKRIVEENEYTLQIGDLLFGISETCKRLPRSLAYGIIPGNHDAPNVIKEHPNFLGRYGYIENFNLFFIGGALSPDWRHRTEGKNWWRDEQLSHEEFAHVIKLYQKYKPKYLVTHDCPVSIAKFFGYGNTSITQNTLEMLQYFHKVDTHFFGHYHKTLNKTVKGIKYKCLPFLGTYQIKAIN